MPDFVGLDYSTKKVSFALVTNDSETLTTGQLALPPKGEFVSNLTLITAYVESELLGRLDFDTEMAALCHSFPAAGINVVIERPIVGMSGNANTATQMAMIAGALIQTLLVLSPRIDIVSPSTWKKAIVGTGKASKEMVLDWARAAWPTHPIANDDVADAVAMADYAQWLYALEEH